MSRLQRVRGVLFASVCSVVLSHLYSGCTPTAVSVLFPCSATALQSPTIRLALDPPRKPSHSIPLALSSLHARLYRERGWLERIHLHIYVLQNTNKQGSTAVTMCVLTLFLQQKHPLDLKTSASHPSPLACILRMHNTALSDCPSDSTHQFSKLLLCHRAAPISVHEVEYYQRERGRVGLASI